MPPASISIAIAEEYYINPEAVLLNTKIRAIRMNERVQDIECGQC
jgi:hypothetical protein